MSEEISLSDWIRNRLSVPVPQMPGEICTKLLGFLKEIREVKKSGKNFAIHIAHLRDLEEDDEAEMFEHLDQTPVQDMDRVIRILESRLETELQGEDPCLT